MGEILLGVLGVVLVDFPKAMNFVAIACLTVYMVLIIIVKPYDTSTSPESQAVLPLLLAALPPSRLECASNLQARC